MVDAIGTPAELLKPGTFIPAFQQPTQIAREDYLNIIHRRSIVLGIPEEEFEQAARAAHKAAGGDVFGRTEHIGQAGAIASQLTPIGLSQIQTAAVEWLIPGLFPRGELSVLGADGGTGKGLWQAQLIAHATTGKENGFFSGTVSKPCRTLIFSGEDDPAKVLRPRLLAAGADVEQVFVETSDSFFRKNGYLLSIDSEAMAEIIRNTAPDLVIVDPYQAFLSMDVKMAERNQMRGATTGTMSAVIPESILSQYISEKAPGAFLEDATKTAIAHAGNLVIPVSSLQTVDEHVENAEITTNGYVPGKLTIEHKEFAYNTGYSDLGMQMSISDMQTIVTDTLIASMSKKMDMVCFEAVAALSYSDDTSAVKLAASTAPTFADLVKLAGMLGNNFIDHAKWYMNAGTFFNWILNLSDSQKRPIFDASKLISEQAPLGYPIRIDSNIPANVIYFGAGKCVHFNYARQPEVNTWTDFDHNTRKFGVRAVSGATAEVGAFVKMYQGE